MRYFHKISLLLSILTASSAFANTFTVTNTNDSGSGSLRKAITDANMYPGSHVIVFNIPSSDPNFNSGTGVWKIVPTSTMPLITKGDLVIDGTTQTTNQGNKNPNGPEILIDGSNQVGNDFAFHIFSSSNVVIKGFIIGGFTIGINISGSSSYNVISGSYIGCNYDATEPLSNTNGIELIGGTHHNTIGGSTPEERNIVSGNLHVGIRIAMANYNTVIGNSVGLDRAGEYAIKNSDGISIEGDAKFNVIGGYTPEERNYVGGNEAYGIPLFGHGCERNLVVGNYIGTNFSGARAVPNTYGVLCDDGAKYNVIGGRVSGARNLISGNSGYGVFLYNPSTMNDSVVGNFIGTDYSGTVALPNANGIVVDGPTSKHFIDSNVISGNLQNGIIFHIGGTNENVVTRNKIGTNVSGMLPLGNGFDGVRLAEGCQYNKIGLENQGNIIAYNGYNGITVLTSADKYNTFSQNVIYGNGRLGIDLFPEGHTPNDVGDVDNGANDLLNFPEIETVFYNSITNETTISGTMDYTIGNVSAIKIELFESDNWQGKRYLGSTFPDNQGEWTWTTMNLTESALVTATATDELGNTSEFYVDFTTLSSGFYKNEEAQIILFPIPTNDFLTIELPSEEWENKQVAVYNYQGKQVFSKMISTRSEMIDCRSFSDGIYTLIIDGRMIKRFVLKK